MNHNLTSRQFLVKSMVVAATLTLICLMASVVVQVQAQEEHEALTIRVSTNRSSCMAGEVIIISGWVGCTKCGVADPAAVVSVDVAGPRGAVLSTSVGTGSDGRFSVQVDTTALYPGTYWVTASVVDSSLSGTWVQTSSRTAFTVASSTQTRTYPTVTATRTYPTAIVTKTYPTATAPVTVTVTKEPTVATARVPTANLVSDVAAPVAVVVTATLGSIAIAASQGLSVSGWWRNVVETINTGVKSVKGGRFKGLISAPEEIEPGTAVPEWLQGAIAQTDTTASDAWQSATTVKEPPVGANASGRIPATPGSYPPEGYIQVGPWYEPLSPAQGAPPTEVEPAAETAPEEVEPATPVAQEPESVSETPPREHVPAYLNPQDDPYHIADEIMKSVIPPGGSALDVFDDDKWMHLTNEERFALVESMAKTTAERMGLAKPKLSGLSSDALAKKFGAKYKKVAALYDHETDTVYINRTVSSWNSAIDCADTIAHELRHDYQWKIMDPKAPKGTFQRACYEELVEHPIDNETDPVGFMKQTTEKDARYIGGRVNDRILQKLWEMKYPKAGK